MTAAVDLALIDAARRGEPTAIVELLVLCRRDVRRYAQSSCAISDVDDAVQETLLVLSRFVSGLRHPRALSTWLFRVVRRECRRLARTTLRWDPWQEAKVEALVQSRSPHALRLDVAAALESLPPDAREIVVLRDFEELTLREIADQLGLTIPATKSRLHRARELTREYLLAQ
ncbi:MAG: sigma-70 family RNA polymerase sigma factor [Nannocystaceae bacterium]|nr:sigma-70 family RNA polymerase sigma factor [Nannocystaceae bacterium]